MRHHGLCILVFGSYVRLGTSTPQQTSSALSTPPPRPTPPPKEPANVKRQDRPSDTCGFVAGSVPVRCSSGTCGYLFVFGDANAHVGCCHEKGCVFQTTCIEDGFASGTGSLAWFVSHFPALTWISTDGSTAPENPPCVQPTHGQTTRQFPFDAQHQDSPRPCPTRAIIRPSQRPILPIPMIRMLLVFSLFNPQRPVQPKTLPWIDSNTVTNHMTGADADSGSPGGLPVYDLAARQRIGAGVGSGGFALLLLGFFAVYGCWKRPRPRSRHLSPSPSQATEIQILAPSEDSEVRGTQGHGMGYARVPLNVT
ncbi:hypothetical protein B0J13DRAFT_560919 [Dactylonectria estremocensis]|uniref:Uncharacterized protein n=1 Tax=Dactylonectria estremocensis TaxID=1079267 RepID=A0A9P9EBX4_9HYPO|nr:hypothetical protein B0J13DRAFT_560919 [Dactylonectria estremocensis]